MAAANSLTPEQRTLRARQAAYTRWSRDSDRQTNAERAQAGLLGKFKEQILAEDPGVTEPELTRRAVALRKAHMARLAYVSSKARTARKGGDET
ncbi:hypothetical protein H0B56_12835 [Haloechinothrix sp. YIM 98757]|uniref:Uncharacterized protein n=1 Tax=Haloechinothrix aidingensis TaxID=2752311 RepID=A0A838AB36_9PSEU|nr:hypothetical protein [Haloechinothrix aidingensis]MBA0126428.1 hypothetical protein [Haloechinothrix aidingensis]